MSRRKLNYKIVDNYLFLKCKTDFDDELLKYFFNRLSMFLCVDIEPDFIPSVLFTNTKSVIEKYYGETFDTRCRAFYDELNLTIIFVGNKYNRKKPKKI